MKGGWSTRWSLLKWALWWSVLDSVTSRSVTFFYSDKVRSVVRSIVLGLPLPQNLLNAMIKESVLKSPASSKWAACGQAFKQISPSFFRNPSSLYIHRIEVVYPNVREWRLTKCKSLFGQGCHHRYFWFLPSPFAVQPVMSRGILNCQCTRASVCSLPTWKCFLWRSWTRNLDKGCFGERTTWCLASKGIGALSRWPRTLTMPSVRSGRKGRSGLLLDSAQLAWRSLYFCLNDSIWAILHKANKASSRSSAVKFSICRSGGGLTLFALHLRLNLYLIHYVYSPISFFQVEYFPHSTTIIEGMINVVRTEALTFNWLSFTWRSSLELDHSSSGSIKNWELLIHRFQELIRESPSLSYNRQLHSLCRECDPTL